MVSKQRVTDRSHSKRLSIDSRRFPHHRYHLIPLLNVNMSPFHEVDAHSQSCFQGQGLRSRVVVSIGVTWDSGSCISLGRNGQLYCRATERYIVTTHRHTCSLALSLIGMTLAILVFPPFRFSLSGSVSCSSVHYRQQLTDACSNTTGAWGILQPPAPKPLSVRKQALVDKNRRATGGLNALRDKG